MPRLSIRDLNQRRRELKQARSVESNSKALLMKELPDLDIYQICDRLNTWENKYIEATSQAERIITGECVDVCEEEIQKRLNAMNVGVPDGRLVLKRIDGDMRIITEMF